MKKVAQGVSMIVLAGVFFFTSAFALKAEEIELGLENGQTALGTLELADESSLSTTPLIVILHDTLAHKESGFVKAQRRLLRERGYNVLAINLSLGLDRRIGMYPCEVPHLHKHTDALSELAQWMTWAEGEGVSSVWLYGHSRGANQVAWYLTEDGNELVEKAILVAPQTWNARKAQADYKARFAKDLFQTLNHMMRTKEKGAGDTPIGPYDFLSCPQTQVSPSAFQSYYRADPRFHTPDLIKKLTLAVLVVAPGRDENVHALEDAMGKLSRENLSFVTIMDAGHRFEDFAAEDLAKEVDGFLQSR